MQLNPQAVVAIVLFAAVAMAEVEPDAPAIRKADESLYAAVLADLLSNPEFAGFRDFYGTPGTAKVVIEGPNVPPLPVGWTIGERLKDPKLSSQQPRVLGVGIAKTPPSNALAPLGEQPFEAGASVCVFNAGGSANGAVIGAGSISFGARQTADGWKVKWVLMAD
jgi:hypothetical protein